MAVRALAIVIIVMYVVDDWCFMNYCLYIYIYIYIHIHLSLSLSLIYIYIYTHLYVHTNIHLSLSHSLSLSLHIYIYIYTYTCIYIYIYTHTYIYIYIHIYTLLSYLTGRRGILGRGAPARAAQLVGRCDSCHECTFYDILWINFLWIWRDRLSMDKGTPSSFLTRGFLRECDLPPDWWGGVIHTIGHTSNVMLLIMWYRYTCMCMYVCIYIYMFCHECDYWNTNTHNHTINWFCGRCCDRLLKTDLSRSVVLCDRFVPSQSPQISNLKCSPISDALGKCWFTPSPPTKSLDFEGFDSSRLLILRGGNSHVRWIV